VLPEEALIKAAASLLSGAIGVFVLASSSRRAANVFLAAFVFLLAGNQFAETMRALGLPGTLANSSWFRIASVFAFLDPLALYAFGSVFPERNRLNDPKLLALVASFCSGLALCAGFLGPDVWLGTAGDRLLTVWAFGTLAIYGAVLFEALRQIRAKPVDSAYAKLAPALCVITIPAVARLGRPVWGAVGWRGILPPSLHFLAFGLLTIGIAAWVVGTAISLPDEARIPRRLLIGGAVGGLLFAVVSKPYIAFEPLRQLGYSPGGWFPDYVNGGGDALKLLTFGVLASAAVLRNQMLDLSLSSRRWAARVLSAVLVLGGIGIVAVATSEILGESGPLAQPAILALFVVVLVSTEGFRRLVDTIGEKAYGVPRGSQREDRIDAYRAAVEQAVEEDRVLGSDPRLRRLREELEIDDRTAHVLERMAGSTASGGPLQPGETIDGRYRIDAFVSRGAAGRIFRAHDELLDRDVAIKELLHGGPHESARALEEARLAGRLEHPNIVTLHDVVTRPGASLLVTEFVTGPTLSDRLEDRGPFGLDELMDVVDGILSGLEAVHDQEVVHGDLKPANVLLAEGEVPKIADFGTSRVADGGTRHALGDERAHEGTPAYMAPEQKRGQPPTVASDLYAVATLTDEIAEHPLPEPIERVLGVARARDPDDRYRSATEMREALREAQRADLTSGR
jgi:hypothetical protein